jgi:hypothetical protein
LPDQRPLAWTWINVLCLVWSLILVTDIFLVHVDTDLEDRPGARAMYLVWNFATTFVWCFEVGLKQVAAVCYHVGSRNYGGGDGGDTGRDGIMATTTSTSSTLQESRRRGLELFFDHWAVRWIEMLLAVFFLVDSFRLLYKWRLKHGDLDAELGEAVLNVLAYLFISYESWILYQRLRRQRRRDYDLEAGSSIPAGTSGTSAASGLLWDEKKNQRPATNDGRPLELPYGTSS